MPGERHDSAHSESGTQSRIDKRFAKFQRQVGGCREWPEGATDRCWKPSEYVLWGKLLPPEALGPRCGDCAAKHIDRRTLGDASAAILDLRKLAKALDEGEDE